MVALAGESQWVRNLRAAGGDAMLRSGRQALGTHRVTDRQGARHAS
jgi:hypothetical protein